MRYGWRGLLDLAVSQLGPSAVGTQTPGTTFGGRHSIGSWHFKDSCAPERPGSAGGTDGCAIDFGMGGANLKALVALYLRPEVARHIPQMIYEHTYWAYGKARGYAPHDHCSHGGNLHLHVAVDPCAVLPGATPPKPRPSLKEPDMAYRYLAADQRSIWTTNGVIKHGIRSGGAHAAMSRAKVNYGGQDFPIWGLVNQDGTPMFQDDVASELTDIDELMNLLRGAQGIAPVELGDLWVPDEETIAELTQPTEGA